MTEENKNYLGLLTSAMEVCNSYITNNNVNNINLSSVEEFSTSKSYVGGEVATQRGYDNKLYVGTVQEDGYIGTGGWKKFKFVPYDQKTFNKNNEEVLRNNRIKNLRGADDFFDAMSKYTYKEFDNTNSNTNKCNLINIGKNKIDVGVLIGKGYIGAKVDILDEDGNIGETKIGGKFEGSLIQFTNTGDAVKIGNNEKLTHSAEINLGYVNSALCFEGDELGAGTDCGFVVGFLNTKEKVEDEKVNYDGSSITTSTEVEGHVGAVGLKVDTKTNDVGIDYADVIEGGVETKIEKVVPAKNS